MLSGADYPIRSAEAIERELSDSQYDVFLDWREINYNLYRTARPDGNKAHGSSEWLRVAYDRYIAVRIPYPALSHPFTKPAGGDIRIRHPFLLKPWQFFSDEFRCYGGEAWFTGNARAAEWLLAKNPRHDALKDFFQRRRCPEESYFQCIFCNAPHLAICNDDKRYIDWSEGGLHPRTLGLQDITKLSESSAHFARKFDQNWAVLDRIDAMIGPG
ncbi:MAG: beta-1,6-N-acetylglucosaminyltransferase [Bryobacteraceae bacterium]